ncbi:MAG: regulator of chromosome condensation epeat family protein [Hyperionvirus sp.]|uniref:Regulator of chromosome condensation epeat family protein n=1 Tax=Hyperionvirus sp. TaxID=2487770 RepID=A0A3G5A672_9VIRU|nr:MAG: regulator of chromosome condensation epeat family protein [Hyperionvirus sp.]
MKCDNSIKYGLSNMDLISLVRGLPIDIQYIVTNYNHMTLFILGRSELEKYDWFKLAKMNLGLVYSRDLCSNGEIMNAYLDFCKGRKSNFVKSRYSEFSLSSDGTLMGRGINAYGELGVGDNVRRDSFVKIEGIDRNIGEVVCSTFFTFIRFMDGKLMSCGNNMWGVLGLGDNKRRSIFEEIKLVPKNVVEVRCGHDFVIIRLTDGTLMSCGGNHYGQLGLGDNGRRIVFEEIVGIPKNIADVIVGSYCVFIKLTDGTLMSCGTNRSGQLGLGDFDNRNVFAEIKNIPKNIWEIKCYDDFTIIKLTNNVSMGCGRVHLGNGEMNRTVFRKIKN